MPNTWIKNKIYEERDFYDNYGKLKYHKNVFSASRTKIHLRLIAHNTDKLFDLISHNTRPGYKVIWQGQEWEQGQATEAPMLQGNLARSKVRARSV